VAETKVLLMLAAKNQRLKGGVFCPRGGLFLKAQKRKTPQRNGDWGRKGLASTKASKGKKNLWALGNMTGKGGEVHRITSPIGEGSWRLLLGLKRGEKRASAFHDLRMKNISKRTLPGKCLRERRRKKPFSYSSEK